MSRRVVITGLGPVSALGVGVEPTWERLCAGESGLGRIQAFDPSGFTCQVAGEVVDFAIRHFRATPQGSLSGSNRPPRGCI